DEVRLMRPMAGMPSQLAFAVASSNQDGAGPSAAGHGDVSSAIAHDERFMQIQAQIGSRLIEHAGVGLSAGAGVCGYVGTIVHGIDASAACSERTGHSSMHFVNERFREIPTAHTRLVGYDHHGKPRLVELANRSDGAA